MVNDTPAGESTASIPREEMRVFATGAMRDGEAGKLDFDGFLSPPALLRFAQYMDKHRHTPAGLRDSDNWQRGIPLDAYRKSMWRHFFDFWMRARAGQEFGPEIEEDLCALLFNVQGFLHEVVKARTARPALVRGYANSDHADTGAVRHDDFVSHLLGR